MFSKLQNGSEATCTTKSIRPDENRSVGLIVFVLRIEARWMRDSAMRSVLAVGMEDCRWCCRVRRDKDDFIMG